ncbi:40S ribosomal protein S2 [Sciurus carolinensis]|uniref:Small ribosomal subunit protein uS5 n=1 Tax=Sciurus carolinensis TaxID=30640 RepID=A0AA41MHA1_SCICA|nr:40S ribosomal protein S2 [Sciurus carolinensis]
MELASSLGKHQMVDDAGAEGAPEWVAAAASVEVSKTQRHSQRQGRGQGVDPSHQLGRLAKDMKDEVLKIVPVRKQTCAGQRTRFKAFVAIGDYNGHAGLGVKCSKEVATAIRGAITLAKLSIVPVRRGYWGNKIGKPHTVPYKATGRCGSVLVRPIPAPRGTGIVSAPVPKKLLLMAGIDDRYTSARGCTAPRATSLRPPLMPSPRQTAI